MTSWPLPRARYVRKLDARESAGGGAAVGVGVLDLAVRVVAGAVLDGVDRGGITVQPQGVQALGAGGQVEFAVGEAAAGGEVVHEVIGVGRLGDRDAADRPAGEHRGQTVQFGAGVVVVVDALRAVVLDAQQDERRVGHVGSLVEQAEAAVGAARARVVADGVVHLDPIADQLAARHPAFVPDHHAGGDDAEEGRGHGHEVLRAQPLHRGCPRRRPDDSIVRSPYGRASAHPVFVSRNSPDVQRPPVPQELVTASCTSAVPRCWCSRAGACRPGGG